MQIAYRNDFKNGEYLASLLKIEQFRLEIKGYVHEKIFFRFGHRYTSDFEPQSIDKIIKGADFAYLRFDLSDKWQLTVGKTFADWGGIEFDMNPIDIYEYSDIIEPSKAALAGVVNWRGKFWNDKFSTLWSYSLFNEAQGFFKNYIALGNQLNLRDLTFYYDFKWRKEDLDRTGVISNEVPDDIYNYALQNTLYYSHWLKIDYRFIPRWQVSFVGFIDNSKWLSDVDPLKDTNDWRKSYGYIPIIEYFPWDDLNLKFFFGYVGRIYNYSDYTRSRLGLQDYNTGRIMICLITPLHVL